jgi:hypothetical protein
VGAPPLFDFDVGYDPVQLHCGLESHRAHVLVRQYAKRTFYAVPEKIEAEAGAAPCRHGSSFRRERAPVVRHAHPGRGV